jgi:hypothetical protein
MTAGDLAAHIGDAVMELTARRKGGREMTFRPGR